LTASLVSPTGTILNVNVDDTFGGWTANCTPVTSPTCTIPLSSEVNDTVGALFYGLSVGCSSATSGNVGKAFNSGTMTVNNGTAPYTFSVEGTLPTGLALNTTTGAVTGTPTIAGSFSLNVTDSYGTSAESACAITIN
jgi:hypothetical protein